MVQHTQTIRRLLPMNCLSVFNHFLGLALKGLNILTETLLKGMSLTYENLTRFMSVFHSNTLGSVRRNFTTLSGSVGMEHWRKNGLIKERKIFDPSEPSIVDT